MSQLVRRQDLPPSGGYKPIPYIRIPAKKYFNGLALFGIYSAVTAVSMYIYTISYYEIEQEEIEARSSKFAILPLLLAERDRLHLKQLRSNRDEESKLMANVKDWKVGTWYGEPIYKTISADTYFQPIPNEIYVHTSEKDANKFIDYHFKA